nr:hypothetical protein BaRGS_033912 [Batillaria attramentaria]
MDDIVVVEILKEPGHKKDLQKQDGSSNTNLTVTEGLAYGQVVGLLERIRYPEVDHPVLYCTLDDMEGHLMRPLCKTVPKIHVMNDTVRNQHKDLLKTRIEIKTITPNGDIEHRGFQDVRPSERELYVFKVAILNWRQKSLYPLGAVLDCHMSGRDYPSGLKVLLMQQRVPTIYPQEVINNTNDILQGGDLSADGREVLTDRLVFTIDPPGSVDLDDALSVWKEGTHYVVGVHIADVALVVQEGSAVDKEARKRAATFYPRLCKPHRMLPEPIDPRLVDSLDDDMKSKEAHALVEELMILTNSYIAKRLRSKFPNQMILICHKPPSYEQLAEWRDEEGGVANLVMQLQGKNVTPDTKLSVDATSSGGACQRQTLMIQDNLWKCLCRCLEDGKIEEARKIAFMDDLHPLQCLANSHWMQIMETAQYKCSYGLNQLDHFHFGLDMAHYTHFTSPIRRYADLHIHRLLHADLNGEIPSCTPDDVTNLCREISSAKSRQKVFQKGCRSLKIADSLQRQPLVFRTFVDQVDSEQLTLMVPSLRGVSDRKQELPFSILGAVVPDSLDKQYTWVGHASIVDVLHKGRKKKDGGDFHVTFVLSHTAPSPPQSLLTKDGDKVTLEILPKDEVERHSDKPYAERIAAFEKLFQQSPSSVDNNVLQNYYKLIRKASVEELGNYEVVLTTCAVAGSSRLVEGLKGKVFQVMIDECAMSPEPHSLVPIIATKARQVVLIGDHKQLRPIITCQAAAELGLEQSLFERLYGRNDVPRMFLNVQYRMMEILSFFKLFEIELQYIKVLTQYNAQRHLLEQKMKQQAEERTGRFNRYDKDKSKHNASTVVSSQGGEWDYVILSTVRSLPSYKIEPHPTHGWCRQNLGFITDKNQVNVALTRAKKGIIIVGNMELLRCDEVWRHLVDSV